MTPAGTRLLMLVDGDAAQQRLVNALAARAGWRTVFASDAETAVAILGTRDGMMLDAILVDQTVAEGDLIADLRARRPGLPILMLTGADGEGIAVRAMRDGVSDFLGKPLAAERLVAALEGAAGGGSIAGELRPLTEKFGTQLGFGEIVGSDPQFRVALAIAAKAARSKMPVLIEGDSGSGKEVVATAIHAASPRDKKPFVIVDCAAVPVNLIESELFGHEKGAFTGAFVRQTGKALLADGGTLFLSEVSRLPMEGQVRLLRLLQSGEVHPIGARGFREADVRVVAGSQQPLADAVAAGRFREDLYYRLAGVQVTLPPLRERRADIPALARHLLARIALQPGLRELAITDDALALISAYEWPGNVRQLHTALFRASVLCGSDALTAADFPQLANRKSPRVVSPRASEAGVSLYLPDGHIRSLDEIEADVIRLAIGHYRGRMTEVARRLGIGRSTLYRKLAELGISDAA